MRPENEFVVRHTLLLMGEGKKKRKRARSKDRSKGSRLTLKFPQEWRMGSGQLRSGWGGGEGQVVQQYAGFDELGRVQSGSFDAPDEQEYEQRRLGSNFLPFMEFMRVQHHGKVAARGRCENRRYVAVIRVQGIDQFSSYYGQRTYYIKFS